MLLLKKKSKSVNNNAIILILYLGSTEGSSFPILCNSYIWFVQI